MIHLMNYYFQQTIVTTIQIEEETYLKENKRNIKSYIILMLLKEI